MRYVLGGVLVLAVVVTLWTSVTQVNAGERGVVRRFGRVIEIAGPGLYIGLPWGIDRVDRVAVDRVRRVTVGYSDRDTDELNLTTPPGQLLTGDHNLVNIQVMIDYAVDDTAVEQFVLYGDQADGLVARVAETVLAEWIASRGVDDVLLTGKVLLPAHVVAETQKRIAQYELGVRIQVVTVPYLFAPKEVKAAFDDVTRAQAEIQTQIDEASQKADRLLGEANTEKYRIEEMADARAREIKAMALAKAKGFENSLALYHLLRKQNPNYLAMLWWGDMNRMYMRIRQSGRVELLDDALGRQYDIWQWPLSTKKD
jgi:membrane protease subunit HflK